MMRVSGDAALIRRIYRWVEGAQVNYEVLYVRLYIAYNAWFCRVTNCTNDREALTLLKQRVVIWDEYARGKALQGMKRYVDFICASTRARPFGKNAYWPGWVQRSDDWKGIIEYWYQVRCRIVHGQAITSRHARLAYETLSIFMNEITRRMKACFTEEDEILLGLFTEGISSEGAHSEQWRTRREALYNKYIRSPNIWNVDMTTSCIE